MTKSKVENLQGNGTWEGQFGTMYSFNIELADGTYGEVNSKSETPPYGVGDEVWYEVKQETSFGKKLKVSTQDPAARGSYAGGGARVGARKEDPALQKRIENSWALQTAVQVLGPKPDEATFASYSLVLEDVALSLLKLRDTLNP